MDDVKARLEAFAQTQGKRLAKYLRDLSEVAAKAAAAGKPALAQARQLFESEFAKIQSKQLSPFAWSLVTAGLAGAGAALVIGVGGQLFDGRSAQLAKLNANVAALSRRVDSIEQANAAAQSTSRAALTTLGDRVAAAENAVAKSADLTKTAISQIQSAVGAQLHAGAAPALGETSLQASGLGGIEQRLAALEAKAKAKTQDETAAASSSHAGEASHAPGAFPPFEAVNFAPVLIWLVLSFGLLYLLMAKLALPRVETILHTRAAKITKDISEANAFRARSEEAAAAHDKTIADARAKSQALAQETHVKLNAEADAKRHALEADLNAKLAAAEAQIAETKAKAMTNVEAIAGEAAAAIVERITGKPADQKAIAAALAATKA